MNGAYHLDTVGSANPSGTSRTAAGSADCPYPYKRYLLMWWNLPEEPELQFVIPDNTKLPSDILYPRSVPRGCMAVSK